MSYLSFVFHFFLCGPSIITRLHGFLHSGAIALLTNNRTRIGLELGFCRQKSSALNLGQVIKVALTYWIMDDLDCNNQLKTVSRTITRFWNMLQASLSTVTFHVNSLILVFHVCEELSHYAQWYLSQITLLCVFWTNLVASVRVIEVKNSDRVKTVGTRCVH